MGGGGKGMNWKKKSGGGGGGVCDGSRGQNPGFPLVESNVTLGGPSQWSGGSYITPSRYVLSRIFSYNWYKCCGTVLSGVGESEFSDLKNSSQCF